MPAPVKFTKARKRAFLAHIANGATISSACAAVKIGKGTFYRHCDDDPVFAAEYDAANAPRAQIVTDRLYAHTEHSWQAAAYWLQNRVPDEWRKDPHPTEVHYTDKTPALPRPVPYEEFTPEQWAEIMAARGALDT